MGLFEKKYCDICGNKIGLLGKRKLSDGLLCKDCGAKLSPWFTESKSSTLEDIRQQLAYREANKETVSRFAISRSIGDHTKLLIDDTAKQFTVASGSSPLAGNPDILNFDQAVSCDLRIDPFRTEKKQTVDGKQVSYQPPKYEYSYTLYATIRVCGNPYFSEMKINIGNGPVSTGELSMDTTALGSGWNVYGNMSSFMNPAAQNPGIQKYYKCLEYGRQMKQAIDEMHKQAALAAQAQSTAAPQPQTAAAPQAQTPVAPQAQDPTAPIKKWFCPNCGTPNEGKFCINCGTKHPYL